MFEFRAKVNIYLNENLYGASYDTFKMLIIPLIIRPFLLQEREFMLNTTLFFL